VTFPTRSTSAERHRVMNNWTPPRPPPRADSRAPGCCRRQAAIRSRHTCLRPLACASTTVGSCVAAAQRDKSVFFESTLSWVE
jgi:hypothetical protein